VAEYFFDSSAIVKRYVNEQGSVWVAATTDPTTGTSIYVVAISGVEVVAALARKLKGNLLRSTEASDAIRRLHHDMTNQYSVVNVSDAVIKRSMAMAEAHALRGYDAVQLGAALELNARRVTLGGAPLTLVTADAELLAAAVLEGLPTDDPNNH
jgi:predicted nucleic acid-binding protein